MRHLYFSIMLFFIKSFQHEIQRCKQVEYNFLKSFYEVGKMTIQQFYIIMWNVLY